MTTKETIEDYYKMSLRDAISLIEAEIDWCNAPLMEDHVSTDFRNGFILGLKQAEYFMLKLMELGYDE